MLSTQHTCLECWYVQGIFQFDCVHHAIVILNLPSDCSFASDRWFLSCWSKYSCRVIGVKRFDGFEMWFVIWDTSGSTGIDLNWKWVRIKYHILRTVSSLAGYIMLCIACEQLWLDTVFCCFRCDSRRSLLVAIDVVSPAVSRLCHLLVSPFASSLAVIGFVSFDAGFNPHTKHHCSLLEMSTNFELAVCS
jgi:hypothetical protein